MKNKNLVKKELKEAKVFLFGSIVAKKTEPGSDIDILVVATEFESPEKRSEIYCKIQKKIGFLSPFEIHLISPKDFKEWYSLFIKQKVEVK